MTAVSPVLVAAAKSTIGVGTVRQGRKARRPFFSPERTWDGARWQVRDVPKTEVAGYHSITSSARSVSDTGLYAVTKNGDKKFWQPVGALWAHADGKGFNLRIDYLPLNEAQLVVREKGDEQAEGNGGAQ